MVLEVGFGFGTGVVSCHFRRMGNRWNNPLFPFWALGFETAWRGLDRGQRGFVLGLVRRRPPSSRGCTNQPVKAGAQDDGGGSDSSVFCLVFRRRRIKEVVCLMRCHACISMLQAGGKTSSCWTDCPLNNRGATPFPAGPGGSDDGTGSIRLVAFNTAIQHRLFLTALVNSRPTERGYLNHRAPPRRIAPPILLSTIICPPLHNIPLIPSSPFHLT